MFVSGAEDVIDFFEIEFGWTPPTVVDVKDVASEHDIAPTFMGLVEFLVGGEYCRRARRFSHVSMPSQSALQHLDLDASIIYEACVRLLNLLGSDMRDILNDARRREEKKSENRSASRSRSRHR